MSDEPIQFKAGDAVPTWLLDVDPTSKWSKKPSVVFSRNVAVVSYGDRYWLLPEKLDDTGPYVTVSDGDDITIFAPGKTVVMPIYLNVTYGPDDRDGPSEPIEPRPIVSEDA